MQSNINENFRILIVDDNSSIHDDYRKILTPPNKNQNDFDQLSMELFDDPVLHSYKEPQLNLDFAFQGEEALQLVKSAYDQNDPYVLIFMDIRMPPGMDGIETVKKYGNSIQIKKLLFVQLLQITHGQTFKIS